MKTFSDRTKGISAIVGITIAYILILLKIYFISEKFEHFSDGRMWAFSEFGFSFLCISIPILIVELVFQIDFRYLLFDLPIIFLLALIYSPDGFYFLYYRGGWFFNPREDAWQAGIYISLIFLVVHVVTVCIIRVIKGFAGLIMEETENGKKQKKDLQQTISEQDK